MPGGGAGGVDLFVRKNEAIRGVIVDLSFRFFHFHDVEEAFHLAILLFAAFFLEGAELHDCPFVLSRESLAVDA